MFWRSVVGKLWFTILLLVSFVLLILTVLLLEFFENYHINETEGNLTNLASNMAHFVEDQELEIGLQISWELLDDVTGAMVIRSEDEFFYSPDIPESLELPVSFFQKDTELSKVLEQQKMAKK